LPWVAAHRKSGGAYSFADFPGPFRRADGDCSFPVQHRRVSASFTLATIRSENRRGEAQRRTKAQLSQRL